MHSALHFLDRRRLVLMTDIKDDGDCASNACCRLEADQQLRRQYDIALDTCPSLGLSWRWYQCHQSITPRCQARPHEGYDLPPGFLEGEWNLDILSQEGLNEMKGVVVEITTMQCCVVAVPFLQGPFCDSFLADSESYIQRSQPTPQNANLTLNHCRSLA
jgi:hypothetical protein